MKSHNMAFAAVIVCLAFAFVLFMMYETRKIDVSLGNDQIEKEHEELIDRFDGLDYEIYWIGELPEHMEGIEDHVTLLDAEHANINTLPVLEGRMGVTIYNPDGMVVDHSDARDYAANMIIVVNTGDELSEQTLDALRNCTVENRVPVLLIGRNNIDSFRERLILVHKEYDEYSTMFYTMAGGPIDDPIEPSIVSGGGYAYANALLEYLRDSFNNHQVVYVTPEVTVQSSQPEETVETEITEETFGN